MYRVENTPFSQQFYAVRDLQMNQLDVDNVALMQWIICDRGVMSQATTAMPQQQLQLQHTHV